MGDTPKMDPDEVERNKQIIITKFLKNVKGRKADVLKANARHDGKHGHWLENAMGLKFNSSNTPDILGFEMKNATLSRTTFGDWSGDYRIFSKRSGGEITQDEFLQIFGQPNAAYDGRYAWSGKICPNKVGPVNDCGQQLIVDENDNISAVYFYSKDNRPNKALIVPKKYQIDGLVLSRWSAELMRRRVESKFNQNGWFKCVKDKDGVYTHIEFGDPITFENWVAFVRSGDVIFDSGMHQSKAQRPYANWRSSNKFWSSLVTSRY